MSGNTMCREKETKKIALDATKKHPQNFKVIADDGRWLSNATKWHFNAIGHRCPFSFLHSSREREDFHIFTSLLLPLTVRWHGETLWQQKRNDWRGNRCRRIWYGTAPCTRDMQPWRDEPIASLRCDAGSMKKTHGGHSVVVNDIIAQTCTARIAAQFTCKFFKRDNDASETERVEFYQLGFLNTVRAADKLWQLNDALPGPIV